MPLEAILDSYLQMIDEEKVQTISEDQAKLVKSNPSCHVVDQWIIHHYTETDLERATTAFKRLVEAIGSRILQKTNSTLIQLPWHDPATFSNQEILPPSSFAYKFLKAISNCKVQFRYIAPGVRFPTVPEFRDQQPITDFITSPYNHHGQYPGDCPLRIFQVDNAEQQPVAYDQGFGLRNITAGFYIRPVMQGWPHFWTNGCRLLLPFNIGGSGWARQSNGEPFGVTDYLNKEPKFRGSHGDLYQSGITNGITNGHLVQMDKVLNNWAERVEMGDWGVDEDGVAGGIDKFREADTEAHWQKYWIPPSW